GTELGAATRFTVLPTNNPLQFINRSTTTAAGSPRTLEIYRPVAKNVAYILGSLPISQTNYPEAVSISAPSLHFLGRLRDALVQNGIGFHGSLRRIEWPEPSPLEHDTNHVEVAA